MPEASRTRTVLALIGAFAATAMVGGVLAAGLAIPAVGATGKVTKSSVAFFDGLPSELDQPPLSQKSRLLAADGSLITTFFDENRDVVSLKKISPNMQAAIIAIEDARFEEHSGVDPKGLVRALVVNKVKHSSAQGASTITQQYVKNVLVGSAVARGDKDAAAAARKKDNARKIKEIRLAVALEKQMTKEQILEGYLNIVPFDGTVYGVQAAAKYYFNTTAAKLTLPQAATLAGMVQRPSDYNPAKNPKDSLKRRNVVLAKMLDLGKIDQKAYAAARATKMTTKVTVPDNGCANAAGQTGYYCEYVRRQIIGNKEFAALGKTPEARQNALQRGGLTIRTAMDPKIMKAAWKAVKTIPPKDRSNVSAATVTVQPGSGKVLSIQQNKTYGNGKQYSGVRALNYSVDKEWGGSAGFQTGSTFKPFTLATWLSKGKSLNAVVPSSGGTAPFSAFRSCVGGMGGNSYVYHNADEGLTSKTSMSVWDGTAGSVNGVYISMEKQLDLCDIRKTAEKLGVRLASPRPDGCTAKKNDMTERLEPCLPSLTLGVENISPMTMAAAYAAFSAQGKFCRPTAVLSITNRNNKPVKVPGADCKQVLDKQVANAVNLGLSRALTDGTAARVGQLPGRKASGKTGTTNDSRNTWFVGYTRQLSTAVWVADPIDHGGEQRSLNGSTIAGQHYGSVFGATLAGPIWKKIMVSASEGMPVKGFERPSGKYLVSPKKAVPNVDGQSLESAQTILKAAGFATTVSPDKVKSKYPKGSVASTSPGGGSLTSVGSSITITLSAGGGDDKPGQPVRPGQPVKPGQPIIVKPGR